jgi:hypothetical protein
LSKDSLVYLEVFGQEAYLDYEDFDEPLKTRQKKVLDTRVAFDPES